MLETVTTSTIFLTISGGKITHRGKNGKIEIFSSVSGFLEGIHQRDAEFTSGRIMSFLDFDIADGDDHFILSTTKNGIVARDIILSLANAHITQKTRIRISTTEGWNKSCTNISVEANGVQLGRLDYELPPIQYTTVGTRTYADDSDRISFIMALVGNINSKLQSPMNPAEATRPEISDTVEEPF